MSKKDKSITTSGDEPEVELQNKMVRIAVFYKNYVKSTPMAARLNVSTLKSYARGMICRDETEIDELIEAHAPVEVFFRYVD